ncbi:hypothetical protein F2P81_005254 [Scophthalmus maximus]|uniref:Uncharacterized protein n=1 Tax=Scophthalmus maximus TaxID=52904 RepID=A0A6A4TI09_SCOMX|nr:hypothetical protein F2P81_005254 [Scophthalmus maximus]
MLTSPWLSSVDEQWCCSSARSLRSTVASCGLRDKTPQRHQRNQEGEEAEEEAEEEEEEEEERNRSRS